MSRQGQLHEAGGIQVSPLPPDRDVEMGSSCTASASAQAHDLAALHDVTFLYLELRKMKVECEQALAVVDDDAVSFEVQETRQQHRAGIHCCDRSAGGNAEVKTEMRALGDAIEYPLRAEHIGVGGIGRR